MSRIVVVDDERQMRLMLCRLLVANGHDAYAASTANEALRLIEKERPHLVVSDVVMPGMSGVEMRSTVERRWPRLPVILISGHSEDGPSEYARKHARTEFMPKPFEMRKLLTMIDKMTGAPAEPVLR